MHRFIVINAEMQMNYVGGHQQMRVVKQSMGDSFDMFTTGQIYEYFFGNVHNLTNMRMVHNSVNLSTFLPTCSLLGKSRQISSEMFTTPNL
jgi:hypothetical protein